jgi:hypothetical protein
METTTVATAPISLRPARLTVVAWLLVAVAVAVAGCSGSGSDDDAPSGGLTDVTHLLEPTEQMRQAAAQQCLDDPDLDVGYIRAVDPNTGNQLAEIEVDCETVSRN